MKTGKELEEPVRITRLELDNDEDEVDNDCNAKGSSSADDLMSVLMQIFLAFGYTSCPCPYSSRCCKDLTSSEMYAICFRSFRKSLGTSSSLARPCMTHLMMIAHKNKDQRSSLFRWIHVVRNWDIFYKPFLCSTINGHRASRRFRFTTNIILGDQFANIVCLPRYF